MSEECFALDRFMLAVRCHFFILCVLGQGFTEDLLYDLPRDSSGADWPVVSWTFFHFLKMDVTFPIFQSLGISSDCHDLSKMSEASQWQETAFFLLDAPCLIPFPQMLPDINYFYNGYCFTLTDSAHRLQPGTWEAFRQALAVKTKAKR